MTLDENRDIAMRFLDALGRGDLDTALPLMADGFELETMGCSFLSAKRDRDGLIELLRSFHNVMTTEITFEFGAVTAQDDRVALEARSSATLIDGRPYQNIYHWLCWIDDGRVTRAREYMDTKYAELAMGPFLQEQQQ